MKKLDIDNLDKKIPYKVPDLFFEKVQSNVFAQLEKSENEASIAPAKKKARIFPMLWQYSAAASIILLFGLIFFLGDEYDTMPINTDRTRNETSYDSLNTKADSSALAYTTEAHSAPTDQDENEPVVEATPSPIEQKAEKKIASATITQGSQPKRKLLAKSNPKKFDENVDMLISAYSSAELAKLSKEAEQDIYLDLFN